MPRYTDDELLAKLVELQTRYGAITDNVIDSEPNFPSRHTYREHFGSVRNALSLIGIQRKPHEFTIQDAQRILDERNSNFILLSFNGMRAKNKTQCRRCGFIWEVSTFSLVRNNTVSHGCPNCTHLATQQKKQERQQRKEYEKEEREYLHEHKLEQLLQENLQTYYILGFIMADGHISENGRLCIVISNKEEALLQDICAYLGHGLHITHETGKNGRIYSCLRVMDVRTLDIIREKYAISPIKTYVPCNIENLNGDKFIAFLIGYIDGDGSLAHRSDTHTPVYRIKVHKSWEHNLNLMSQRLYEYAGIPKCPKAIDVHQGTKVYTEVSWGNQTVINYLHRFIIQHQLFVLDRKWCIERK